MAPQDSQNNEELRQSITHFSRQYLQSTTGWTASPDIDNQAVWTPVTSPNPLTLAEMERLYQQYMERPTLREEEPVTSIEDLVIDLYSHNVSQEGKQFLIPDLRMKKFPGLGYSAIVSNVARDTILIGDPLMTMYFDGRMFLDRMLRHYITSRAWNLLECEINKSFLYLCTNNDIKEFMLVKFKKGREARATGKFNQYLTNRFGNT